MRERSHRAIRWVVYGAVAVAAERYLTGRGVGFWGQAALGVAAMFAAAALEARGIIRVTD